MPDYKKSKIYRIVCNITGDTYYGSTCQLLCNRKAQHKARFKQDLASKCASYDIIERSDWSMLLVENYPCNNKEELLMRERHYIENNKCINKVRPIISVAEHKEKKKAYKEANKEEILAKQREYYHNNKEKNKEHRDKYREDNRETKILKDREYYAKNKDKVVTCECGMELKKWSLSGHKKSNKHKDFIAQKCEE
jgi:hypothetical protein